MQGDPELTAIAFEAASPGVEAHERAFGYHGGKFAICGDQWA